MILGHAENELFIQQQNFGQVKIESIRRRKTLKCSQKMKICFGNVGNIVLKGQNADYQHFPLFPQCFLEPCFSGLLKVGFVW